MYLSKSTSDIHYIELFLLKKLNTFIFTVTNRALSSATPHLSPGPSTKKLYLGLAVGLDPQSPLIDHSGGSRNFRTGGTVQAQYNF